MNQNNDENVTYDGKTLVLQALQVDPREIEDIDLIISDLYYYHFKEQNIKNDALFEVICEEAGEILGVKINMNDTIKNLINKLYNL